MKTETTELAVPSRLEAIDAAAAQAARVAAASGVDEAGLFGIDLAVREAVANAVKHGNQFDETKTVEIVFHNSANWLEITVRDFGAGFCLCATLWTKWFGRAPRLAAQSSNSRKKYRNCVLAS